ncbi:MAG: ribonuclease III [Actinomycetes bacterium]
MSLEQLSEKLGVHLEPQLLEVALTHRSYSYEHPGTPNNERLEFLGDAVLGFVVTEYIFHKLSDLPENELTQIRSAVVSAKPLAQVAENLELAKHLRLGRGVAKQSNGRAMLNLMADAVEAIIGAALVSQGLEAARTIIEKHIYPLIEDPSNLLANSDPKSTLFELVRNRFSEEPHYELESTGPAHDLWFTAEVSFGGKVRGAGKAATKKQAEAEAAIAALAAIENA